jgi:hypothetical protein
MATTVASLLTTSHHGKHDLAPKSFDYRVPHAVPKFTLEDVKKAIPPHLFERPALTSLWYLFRDIVTILSLVAVTMLFNPIALHFASFLSTITMSDTSLLTPYFEASASRSLFTDGAYALFYQPFLFKALFTFQLPLVFYSLLISTLWIVYFWLQGVFFTGLWVWYVLNSSLLLNLIFFFFSISIFIISLTIHFIFSLISN